MQPVSVFLQQMILHSLQMLFHKSNICFRKGNYLCFYWLFWWNFELFCARFHLTGMCIIRKVRNFNRNNGRAYDGLWKWYYKNKICVLKEPRWWAVRKAVFRNTIKMMYLSQCMWTVDATGYYIKLLIGFQFLMYKYSSWSRYLSLR